MMTLFGSRWRMPPTVLPAHQDRRAELGQRCPPAGHRGLTLTGSTPAKYENWLNQLIDHANTSPFFGEAFVCVNAWNEWCEGAYLEPDLHYRRGLSERHQPRRHGRVRSGPTARVVLVGHDAFPSGAQQLLLNIGHDLRARHGVEIEFLLLGGGKLQDEYAAIAPTTVAGSDQEALRRLKELHERGFTSAIVNTTAAARIVPGAKALGFDTHLLVHELPRIIREKDLAAGATAGLAAATSVVFPAPSVRDKVTETLDLAVDDRMHIIQNGLYKKISFSADAAERVRGRARRRGRMSASCSAWATPTCARALISSCRCGVR